MTLRRRWWLALGLTACERRASPPPPRPRVTPEPRADAGTSARVVAPAPAPPPEGPCALAIAGGAPVAALRGRVDRLRVAADASRLRLVAELAAPHRGTLGVLLDAAGTASPAETLSVGVRDARISAAPVAVAGELRDVRFGVRSTNTEAQEFALAHSFFVGRARGPQILFAAEELVAASDGARWAAAATGDALSCFERTCEGTDRMTSGMVYHPRDGFGLRVVTAAGEGLRVAALADAQCDLPDLGDDGSGRPATIISADEGDDPPERCRAARPWRPTDVALAVHGDDVVVAWRTS